MILCQVGTLCKGSRPGGIIPSSDFFFHFILIFQNEEILVFSHIMNEITQNKHIFFIFLD